MRIHVVGAGVAGLTLAAASGAVRADLVLYEDGPDRGVGTALGRWPAAMTALDSIGAGSLVRRRGVFCTRGELRRADGALLRTLPPSRVWLVRRGDLLAALGACVPGTVLRVARRVTGIDDLDEVQPGDVVVGADGSRSVIRRELWGPPCRSTGVTAVRGVVDEDLADGMLREFWGAGAHFGTTPDPGGGTNWFATFAQRRLADRSDALDHARRHLAGFPPGVQQVLAGATPDRTLVNDVVRSRPLRHLHRGDVVLVGDAAHAMAPNLGRGACEAVVDAVALAHALRDHAAPAALTHYERQRLLPPQAVRLAAGAAQRLSLAPRHLWLRDVLVSGRLRPG